MMGFVFLWVSQYSDCMSILLALLLSFQARAVSIVTETVGQVAEHVVTSREVQISMVIENVLFPSNKKNTKDLYEVRAGQPQFRAALTQVLLEAVVALEAENFNVASISEEDVAQAVAKVEKAVAGKAYWAQIGASKIELKRFVQRNLMAKSFLKFKTTSMSSIVSDVEAENYFTKNRNKFGDVPFESFRENIKAYLAQQQLEERLRSWFEVIKRKYKVRNLMAE